MPLPPRSVFHLPSLDQSGQSFLEEGAYIMHHLQPLSQVRFATREHLQSALTQLPHGADLGHHLPGEVTGTHAYAEVLPPGTGHPHPLNGAELHKQPCHGAYGALAGSQRIRDLTDRLVWRVTDQKPPENAPGHSGETVLIEEKANLLSEALGFQLALLFVQAALLDDLATAPMVAPKYTFGQFVQSTLNKASASQK